MFSVSHRDPSFCPHSPYFIGYGVQKRRLRLVTINRAKPCSFYDLGIRWQLSVWNSFWASKQEVGRLSTCLGHTGLPNEQHCAFCWPARFVQSSPHIPILISSPSQSPNISVSCNLKRLQISSSSESHHFVLKVQPHHTRLSECLTDQPDYNNGAPPLSPGDLTLGSSVAGEVQ